MDCDSKDRAERAGTHYFFQRHLLQGMTLIVEPTRMTLDLASSTEFIKLEDRGPLLLQMG